MRARGRVPLCATCVVSAFLLGCGDPERSPDFEAELARIERAKPQPPVKPPSGEQLSNPKKFKKVKGPGGGIYYFPRHGWPPRRTATAAVDGCDTRTYKRREGDVKVTLPHPPGVTAKFVGDGLTLQVTYRVGEADDCRPTHLSLTADISDDFAGGNGGDFPITDEEGQIEMSLQGHVVNADILTASSWTPANGGVSSASTTIRIR
jgi:hypothetical protein